MVVAVLTRVVAVLTRVVAVLECRRFGMSPFLLSPFRLVAVMTGTRHEHLHAPDGLPKNYRMFTADPLTTNLVDLDGMPHQSHEPELRQYSD